MIDRLRSPGTVRKLSLKMKKLPELRRKLSLRSSSRAHRQGNDGRGGGDESTSKNAASSSALSNQNVISRYHLDSSAPPARPLRRSSRGRSASKGGKQHNDNTMTTPVQHIKCRAGLNLYRPLLAVTVTPTLLRCCRCSWLNKTVCRYKHSSLHCKHSYITLVIRRCLCLQVSSKHFSFVWRHKA